MCAVHLFSERLGTNNCIYITKKSYVLSGDTWRPRGQRDIINEEGSFSDDENNKIQSSHYNNLDDLFIFEDFQALEAELDRDRGETADRCVVCSLVRSR